MSDWTNHLKKLEDTHQEIDKKIDIMEKTGNFSDNNITELKRQRLHLKDEIARIKAQHNGQ